MFDSIVTLTLHPAIDVTLWVNSLTPGQDNPVRQEMYEAGGKGMNISRTLHSFGVESVAIALVGKHNQHRYEQRLRNEGVNYRLIPVDGYSRENISIVQEKTMTVTRIIREGFAVNDQIVDEILEELRRNVRANTLVVVTGSMPKGMAYCHVKRICDLIQEMGGLTAIDLPDLNLDEVRELKPWFIKPNYEELCSMAGHDDLDEQEIVRLAREMNSFGVEHVIVSLRDEGLIYSGSGHTIHVAVPAVDAISTTGSGDCAIAGFIRSLQEGRSVCRSVMMAAAFGTAACLSPGVSPPARLAVANIYQNVQAEEIE